MSNLKSNNYIRFFICVSILIVLSLSKPKKVFAVQYTGKLSNLTVDNYFNNATVTRIDSGKITGKINNTTENTPTGTTINKENHSFFDNPTFFTQLGIVVGFVIAMLIKRAIKRKFKI